MSILEIVLTIQTISSEQEKNRSQQESLSKRSVYKTLTESGLLALACLCNIWCPHLGEIEFLGMVWHSGCSSGLVNRNPQGVICDQDTDAQVAAGRFVSLVYFESLWMKASVK